VALQKLSLRPLIKISMVNMYVVSINGTLNIILALIRFTQKQAGINQVPFMIPVLSNNRTLECNKLVMETSRNFDAHEVHSKSVIIYLPISPSSCSKPAYIPFFY